MRARDWFLLAWEVVLFSYWLWSIRLNLRSVRELRDTTARLKAVDRELRREKIQIVLRLRRENPWAPDLTIILTAEEIFERAHAIADERLKTQVQ